MKKASAIATVLIAASAVCTGAFGQNVYRCGAHYSQTPCPDAVTVEVGDARSPLQKAEADKIIARDVAAATTLEQARLKEEARVQAHNIPNTRSGKAKTAKAKARAKKKKTPEFFTAKVSAEKKKEKAPPAH